MTPHDPRVPLLLQETQWSCYFKASLLLPFLTYKKQLEKVLKLLSEGMVCITVLDLSKILRYLGISIYYFFVLPLYCNLHLVTLQTTCCIRAKVALSIRKMLTVLSDNESYNYVWHLTTYITITILFFGKGAICKSWSLFEFMLKTKRVRIWLE